MNREKASTESRSKPTARVARRSFLNALWMLLAGVALAELGWVVSDFLFPKPPRAEPARQNDGFVAGKVDRFEIGSVTRPFPKLEFTWSAWISAGSWPFGASAPISVVP